MKKDYAYVVKAIVIRDDKILVLRRSKEERESSYINKNAAWDLPGGGVRFFETGEDALFREIKEETGLKVRLIKLLNARDIIRSRIHLVILTHICVYIKGEVILSGEHDKYYWLSISEMEDMDIPQRMIHDFKIALTEYKMIKEI